MAQLNGIVAVVTGAGRGIGAAIAETFAREGATVALLGRNTANLEQVAAGIASAGSTALPLPCDVSDEMAIEQAFAHIRAALGPVGILVNNAGVTASIKFQSTDTTTWEQIMRVNATGPFWCCRAAVGDMVQHGGRIINIASIAGIEGLPFSSAYSASKHALIGLTRSLALELSRYGITANAICPGWVDTDMLRDAVANVVAKTGRDDGTARQSILALSEQQRALTPADVAAEVLRLAGPEGAGINGDVIVLK